MERTIKNKKRCYFFLVCMIGVILLSGCKDDKKTEKALEDIKNASKATEKLKKGDFEFTYEIDDGDKDAKKANQKVIGTFTVKDNNNVDWTRKVYIGEESEPRAEQKQEDGVQYQNIKDKGEWIPINENAVAYPPDMDSLMNMEWTAEDVKSAEIKEEDGNTIYQLEFNEEFLKKLKKDEVSAIEKELKIAKKDSSSDEEYLKGLENSVEDYKAINYTAYKAEALKSDKGVLVSMKTQITTVDTSIDGSQESTVTTKVKLENYN